MKLPLLTRIRRDATFLNTLSVLIESIQHGEFDGLRLVSNIDITGILNERTFVIEANGNPVEVEFPRMLAAPEDLILRDFFGNTYVVFESLDEFGGAIFHEDMTHFGLKG